jgi:hypothetical protein
MEPFSRGLDREFILAEMKSWNLIVRGILILYLCPHPKLSRYGTAIEDSLEASGKKCFTSFTSRK